MLSKLLLCLLLLDWSVNADLVHSFGGNNNNNNGGIGLGHGSTNPNAKDNGVGSANNNNNNRKRSIGRSNNDQAQQNQQGGSPYYNNQNNDQAQQNQQGGSPYYSNQNNDQKVGQGLGQGYTNKDNANPGLGQGYGGNTNGQGLGQGYDNNDQGYSGLGQGTTNTNGYSGLGQPKPNAQRDILREAVNAVIAERRQQNGGYDAATGLNYKPLNQRRKRQLGQDMQPQSLGQGQDQGLGQGTQSGGLGQGTQPQGLGQGTQPGVGNGNNGGLGGGLSGSLRLKRYAERESYKRTCNTYYGKYICYRLYDRDASIPNDFTCWQTYIGKKNCTETENVLYLDRRNVEVDPNEQLDRQFYPNNNDRRVPSLPDNTHHDRYRQQDDEFGAVEKNLHNQRQSERRLPDDGYKRTH